MVADVDRAFKALADPNRRAMVERLSRGAVPLSALARDLPITLSAALQHVNVLEASGLVETRKTGRVRTCFIRADGLAPLDSWVAARRADWEVRLDRLGDVLVEGEGRRA